MPREIKFDEDLEPLWRRHPKRIPDAAIRRLRLAVASLRGSQVGISSDVIRGTFADDLDATLRLASHVRANVEALPDPVRRISLAALVLLPLAYSGAPDACRALAGLFDVTACAPLEPGIRAALGEDWSVDLMRLADAWRRHGGCRSADDDRPELEPVSAIAEAPPSLADDSPSVEEIQASVARVLGGADAATHAPASSALYVSVLLGTPPASEAPSSVDLRRYTGIGRLMVKQPSLKTAALDRLNTVFPQFAEVTESVRRELHLAVGAGARHFKLSPRLLIGPPGAGKSRYLGALADALDRPARFLSAGASDARNLIGTARGWSSATPSFPVTVFAETLRADPMIFVDELDKADTREGRCALQSALLAMMEPSTASVWRDECLMVDCDLSWISWMLTANTAEGIVPALLDRCRVHRIGPPSPFAVDAYISTVLEDVANELGVPVGVLPPLDPVVHDALRAAFRRNPSLRDLKRALRNVLAIAPHATRH